MHMDRVIVALVNSVACEGKAAHEVVWGRLPATPKARRLLDSMDAAGLADHIQDVVQDSQERVSKETRSKWVWGEGGGEECVLPRMRSEPNVVGTARRGVGERATNGLIVLNGMLLVVAAQHLEEAGINFGVKCTIGKRPRMEDSHCVVSSFMNIPLSLECTQEVIPDYLKGLKSEQKHGTTGNEYWSIDKDKLRALYGEGIQCVFDEFHMFTVCDGHGGNAVASYCTDNVRRNLEKALNEHLENSFSKLLSLCTDTPKQVEDKKQDKNEITETKLIKHLSSTDAGCTSIKSLQFSLQSERARGTNHVSCSSLVELANCSSRKLHNGAGKLESVLKKQKIGLTADAIATAMRQSFEWLNDEVLQENLGQVQGSTMVMALVGAWFICIAGCGDSRGVLCRGGHPIRLTRDHKPDLEDEKVRIGEEGGFVVNVHGCSRVNGILAMTRAIGDHTFKGITSAPEVAVFHRNVNDEFLILASDGLWDVVSDQEACSVTRRSLQRAENRGASPELAARGAASVLMKAAVTRGSLDNTTVVVVDLRQGCSSEIRESKRARTGIGN